MAHHIPVLKDLVTQHLITDKNGIYIDCTLGEGGHSQSLLDNLSTQARLIGLDVDSTIQSIAKQRLSHYEAFEAILANFSTLPAILESLNISHVDGIFADLGISMFHYKESEKGFSFYSDVPLDMTLAKTRPNAWDVVNRMSVQEISDILKRYGEEKNHYRIAKFIDYYCKHIKEIETTKELANIIEKAVVSAYKGNDRKIHPATKSFQAIRIFVNKELENLLKLLENSLQCLKVGGKFVVLTYHSLEDKIVKQFFLEKECNLQLKIKTRKPIMASSIEISLNPASRSARLRVYEKLRF